MQAIYALTIIFAYYAAGELVSSYTKAKVPSSVARSIIILTTLWTGIVPTTIFDDAGYSSFAMLMIGIMITGMGSTIDFTEAKRQIKTVIVAVLGMAAGVVLILVVGSMIIKRAIAFAGAPIYAGGQAALLLIMTEMADKGEDGAQIAAICTLCHYIQQYFGLPVSSFFLKRAGRRLLSDEQEFCKYLTSVNATLPESIVRKPRKKLIVFPDRFRRPSVFLAKLGLVTSLASFLSNLTEGRVNYLVIALVLGFLFTEAGFLEKNILEESDSQGLIMILISCAVLRNLARLTPGQLISYIVPISVIMIIGLIGTTIAGFFISKAIKMDPNLGIGLAMTCTYGFPNTLIVANDVSEALSRSETEKDALLSYFRPKLLVAGFVTVTISSVFIAAAVVNYIL